jgi:glycolate oxidase FAD binding subunit
MIDAAVSVDLGEELAATIKTAAGENRALYIKGGDSKRHTGGRACDCASLDVSRHRGIVDYQPGELVLTARCGTSISEILTLLEANGQTLSFEPPVFGGSATLGGTIACNQSGPGRPWGGAARDRVLGVAIIAGDGRVMQFGGRVMKNVAGYDVSRLQAGALGTLGVLSEISVKVVPRAEKTLTLAFEMNAHEAVQEMNRRGTQPKPLSAAAWWGGRLYLRLSGARRAVEHTARLWGGDALAEAATPWQDIREMTLPFFDGDSPLWRYSVSPTLPATQCEDMLIDWGGALRWSRGEQPQQTLQSHAVRQGGHVSLHRGGDRHGEVKPALSDAERHLHLRLKQVFDPGGTLNPGRLYSWM